MIGLLAVWQEETILSVFDPAYYNFGCFNQGVMGCAEMTFLFYCPFPERMLLIRVSTVCRYSAA